MPSPILHTGFALGALEAAGRRGRRALAWAAGLAVWPDLDLVPGLLLGDPHRFHHGATHAPAVQALAALAVARVSGLPRALAVSVALSHCALDLLNFDPFGDTPAAVMSLPLFWPLSSVRVPMLWPVFGGAHLTMDPASWAGRENLALFAREAAAALLLVAAGAALRRFRNRVRPPSPSPEPA